MIIDKMEPAILPVPFYGIFKRKNMTEILIKYNIIFAIIIVLGTWSIHEIGVLSSRMDTFFRRSICCCSICSILYLFDDIMGVEIINLGASDMVVYVFLFGSDLLFYCVIYFWVNIIDGFFDDVSFISRPLWAGFTCLLIVITKSFSLWRHVLGQNAEPLGFHTGWTRMALTLIYLAFAMLVSYIAIRYIIHSVNMLIKRPNNNTVWIALIITVMLLAYVLWAFAWDFSRTWPALSTFADITQIDPLGYIYIIANLSGLLFIFIYRKKILKETDNDGGYEQKAQILGERHGLSKRETEVLELMLQGMDNSAMADRLCISPNTLRHHISSIYKKTGASNRVDLILME